MWWSDLSSRLITALAPGPMKQAISPLTIVVGECRVRAGASQPLIWLFPAHLFAGLACYGLFLWSPPFKTHLVKYSEASADRVSSAES